MGGNSGVNFKTNVNITLKYDCWVLIRNSYCRTYEFYVNNTFVTASYSSYGDGNNRTPTMYPVKANSTFIVKGEAEQCVYFRCD